MKEVKNHDLFDFMLQISQEMSFEYERIQKRATEDPGTAGDQGEENWAELLRDWLPPTYQVVTKGRIISEDGKTSPQVDVIVLKSFYPKKLLNKKLYLAAGVAAAFECKVTLKAAHITEALKNCIEIKSLFPPRKGSPFKDLNTPIIYGLLAHSHSWKGEMSTPAENITNKLIEEDCRLVDHPRKMIDLICVADLGSWASSQRTFLLLNKGFSPDITLKQSRRLLIATTAYYGHTNSFENQVAHFKPVGAFIFYLFQKLAWENEEYRSLADYYQMTNISGAGNGRIREWGSNIFSDETKEKLDRNIIGLEKSILSNCKPWSEWSVHIEPS
ncbi:MAG TPA: DUF6602 domain-containing protein [Nodularia sp. (in: cyanobacteria)]|nr:DUF6602 domain-containing protein [Nodularia sp. (in: cyanobacteria)]